MEEFVHLHVHTEYSLLDGANRIDDLISRVKELGMKSVAITDHGVMYGVIDFYKKAVKNSVKPILGCEVYTARRSRTDKESSLDSEYGHLVLLAKDLKGYKNLMKLVSIGFTEGYYYKPRVDIEVLKKYSEGIIALSACLSGDVPRAISQGNYEGAKERALLFNEIYGQDNFYLELQSNGMEEQNLVNQKLIKLSRETGIPLVATNDAHYLRKEDARAHEILLCIQTGKTINDENRMRFNTDEAYVKSPEEMQEEFSFAPEAIANTVKIAQKCNVELEFNKLHLPKYDVPEGRKPFEFLSELCYKGLEHVYKDKVDEDKKSRLNYELSVIKEMGYVDYFLIVWDFIKYAKENGIAVGPGRGSAAGSLVSYTLGITTIDPLKYNLLFERFLNPERVSMPDIDVDFCYERRQEVIDYVVEKYGKDRVAQIITFGTMAARAVIRDVGRALDISYGEVDQIAKMIPMQIGMNIEKALDVNPELMESYRSNNTTKELIDTARLLEGMPRHASTHAAGVVISKDPIMEYVPLAKNDDNIVTQFPMGLLEELGLLKMDFLGLRTLTVIRDCVQMIKENHGVNIDIDNIDMDDPKVFKMISDGKTCGVFQLESSGMTQFMKDLQPSSLEDIIAGISLYRPGPMDQIPRYIRNKNNPSEIRFHHPLLENILDVTYGCMVYQEQVMQIVRELAGYSMGRSDLVRRAMAKKKVSVMEEERKNFIYGIVDENGNVTVNGALRNGVDENTANVIFDEMMDFASYAFNKSHAAAYAVVGYQTAWLKYYYPVELMAALMNSFLGSSDKVSHYVYEAKGMGIEVLPPDINESSIKFTVVNGKIRFGMAAIKNVGEAAVDQIIQERNKSGAFVSFIDFCKRLDAHEVNKRCVESLIKAGCFDSTKIFRSQLMAIYEKTLDGIAQTRKRNYEGQLSIFDTVSKQENISVNEGYPNIKEYGTEVLLTMEKEMLGLYVSGHPLDKYKERMNELFTITSYDLSSAVEGEEEMDLTQQTKIKDGKEIITGGIIVSKTVKTTKNNKTMAFITVEDIFGTMEIIVFPNILSRFGSALSEESIIAVKGKITMREGEQPKIICDEAYLLDDYGVSSAKGNNIRIVSKEESNGFDIKQKGIYLRIEEDKRNREFILCLDAMLRYFSGTVPVILTDGDGKDIKVKNGNYTVMLCKDLIDELNEKLGKNNIYVNY